MAKSQNAHMPYFLKKALGGSPKLISSISFAGRLQKQLLKPLTEEQTHDIPVVLRDRV